MTTAVTLRPLMLAALLGLAATPLARAEADGPDFLRVTGEGALPLAAAPADGAPVLAEVPAGTDGLMSFGCRGGLDFAAWSAASEAERAAAAERRRCLVGHGAAIGWGPGPRLAEGSDAGAFAGGARLMGLAGSEWTFRDIGGTPAAAEAWINFGGDESVHGSSGCNRFMGGYEESPGRLALGPLASTRMACDGARDETEAAVERALGAAAGYAGGQLLMVLLDAEGAVLATLTRRDPD